MPGVERSGNFRDEEKNNNENNNARSLFGRLLRRTVKTVINNNNNIKRTQYVVAARRRQSSHRHHVRVVCGHDDQRLGQVYLGQDGFQRGLQDERLLQRPVRIVVMMRVIDSAAWNCFRGVEEIQLITTNVDGRRCSRNTPFYNFVYVLILIISERCLKKHFFLFSIQKPCR